MRTCLKKNKTYDILHSILCFLLFLFIFPADPLFAETGCLTCHNKIEPISPNHDFPCVDCHKGHSESTTEIEAHKNLLRNPSDPKHVETFCGSCHAKEIKKMTSSLHFTNAGIINQTRYLWGAQDRPYPPTYGILKSQKLTPLPTPIPEPTTVPELVDDLLRRRCLKCHLISEGQAGRGFYRSSGCAACHMVYNDTGTYQGQDPTVRGKVGYSQVHRFTTKIPSKQCLHCHNGNRVGSDYFGYFEHDYEASYRAPLIKGKPPERIYGLDFHRLTPDLHSQAGMDCIDCHTQDEVMGDGKVYGYSGEALKISCESCHGGYPVSTAASHPGMTIREGKQFITTKISGRELQVPLFAKETGVSHNISEHRRVACAACHAQWSYQDYGLHLFREDLADYWKWARLHIQGDMEVEALFKENLPKGISEWSQPETFDGISGEKKLGVWYLGWLYRRWEVPPLGIGADRKTVIFRPLYQYYVTFVNQKGWVLIDSQIPRRGDDLGLGWASAPYTPHTIGKVGRACEACHLNPKAVGFGERLWKDHRISTPLSGIDILPPPILPQTRLYTDAERNRLLKKSKAYKRYRVLDLKGRSVHPQQINTD